MIKTDKQLIDMITDDNNKNIEYHEPQTYVPAKIKVINVTAQRVMCTSTEQTRTEQLDEETFSW